MLSPLLLHKSRTIHLLLLESHHHLTPSHAISKLTTLSRHNSHHLSTTPHLWLNFFNSGASGTNLVRYELHESLVSCHLNITVWRQVMASTSHTDEETGSSSSQVPMKTARNHVEIQSVRNEETRRKTGLRKLELIIKERRLRWLGHVLYLVRLHSGNWGATRESRDAQGKTGRTSSDEIWRTSPGMKPKNWQQTEQNGVNVWHNAPIWMWDELRSKVRSGALPNFLHYVTSLTHELVIEGSISPILILW